MDVKQALLCVGAGAALAVVASSAANGGRPPVTPTEEARTTREYLQKFDAKYFALPPGPVTKTVQSVK